MGQIIKIRFRSLIRPRPLQVFLKIKLISGCSIILFCTRRRNREAGLQPRFHSTLDKVLPPLEMKEESRQVAGSVRAAVPSSHTKAGRMMLLTLLHSTRQGKLGCRFYLSGVWLRGKKGLAITRELQNPTAFVSFIGKKRKEEKKKCLWITVSPSLLLLGSRAPWENKIFP